jgi:preprotein translocase subunit SecF
MSEVKMFQFIKNVPNVDFVGKFKFLGPISLILVIVSIVGFFAKVNYGVDFRGGAEIQVKFGQGISLDSFRKSMGDAGFQGTSIQSIGLPDDNEFLVKVQGDESNLNQLTESIETFLNTNYSSIGAEIRKIDIVGPKAGANLRLSGFQAMFWALLSMLIYIGLRFDFKFGPAATIGLFHTVAIILGIFAVLQIEFTLQIVAAILAVIGYAINDTVIIFDRIRENERKNPNLPLRDQINIGVNETMSRSIITSGSTLFVSGTLYFFGGLAIRDFFLTFSAGVIVGTYSSIFIASSLVLFFDRFVKKEATDEATVVKA